MSRRLFDLLAPFEGRHNPLRNGWGAEQLDIVAQALGTTNPTIAFVACSLITEQRTTGRSLRYSRSQKNYSYFESFEGDPLMTYRRVVPAADWLIKHGFAQGHMGLRDFKKQSILQATERIMALAQLVDINGRQGAILKDEIILRDKDRKIGFSDTAEIRRMRVEMKTINAHLAAQRYFTGDVEMYIPPAARIFNQNFRRGGRLYHQGPSYQQLKKDDRKKIAMLVDGEVSPMVELDFESLHMKLAYLRAGKTMPNGDLYEIDGFNRKLAKVATLISLNANGTEVGAIISALQEDEELALDNNLHNLSPTGLRVAIEKLIAAIKRKHYRVKDFFGTGVGAELMRTDSDIAVKIMLAMIEKTGRCPLVVHDSFLVPVCDKGLLQALMVRALAEAASSPSTNKALTTTKNGHQSFHSSSLIHMGKHSVDQGGSILTKPLVERAYVRSHADRYDPGHDPPPEDLQWPSWTTDLTLTATSTE